MSVWTQLAQSNNYYYDYPSSGSATASDSAAVAAVFGVFMVFFLFAAVVSYVIHAFLLGRVFKKAGVEQWIAWVPFYNSWKLLELGGQQGFWAILAIIPVVNIVSAIFMYIAMYHVGLKLQKEGWFVLLAIFIPTVWLIWLAFDGSVWSETGDLPEKVPAKAPATESTDEK